MLLILTWVGGAVVASGIMARWAMKRGRLALRQQHYLAARGYLERAARHDAFRIEAITLGAEAAIFAGRPADACDAINTVFLHQQQMSPPAVSIRVRLLRGIAECLLGRPMAGRQELAAIPRAEASIDGLLAAAQACVLARDRVGALQLCDELEREGVADPVAGRVQLCRSAIFFHAGKWAEALAALPHENQCTPEDAIVCRRIRQDLGEKIAAQEGAHLGTSVHLEHEIM